MSEIRFWQVLALIFVVFGYFSCGLALQSGLAVPAILYWSLFLAIPCISLLLVSDNETYNVLLLLTVAFSVYSMYFLQNLPWYPAGRDTQFEMQIASLIFDTGKWAPMMGTSMGPELSYHPMMHILTASFSLITGINPYQAMFIIPWLKGIGLTLFFYLFARNFLSNPRNVFFASMLFMGCVFFLGFPHREIFAEIFFMGALWIYTKKKIDIKMKTVLVLLIFALAASHHFTSYIFLLLSVALYLFDRRRKIIHPLLPAMIILSWMLFISFSVTYGYITTFLNALGKVMTLTRTVGPTLAATSYYYTPFENLLILLNPILIGMMALLPFLKELRSRKRTSLLIITFILGGLFVVGILFLLFQTQMGVSFSRVWGFAYIPLSIWASMFFWEKFRNTRLHTILSLAIITILFVSMNLSVLSGIKRWYVPPTYMETFMFSDSMVNTAYWCNANLNGSILADNLAYCSVGSWGYQEVDEYTFIEWYRTKNNELLSGFDYIILSPWDKVTYSDAFRELIDPFALLPEGLNVIYSSGDLVVYFNSQ